MNKASAETYRSLPEDRVSEITKFLKELQYSEEQKTKDINTLRSF